MRDEILKAKEGDTRCIVMTSQGECPNQPVENGTVCLAHGGNRQLASMAKEASNNYRIQRYSQRLKEMKGSPDLKSLRDEIGLLRILLEEKFNRHQDDILTYAGPLSDMIMKIEKVVTSCHKLEGNMGLHLDKSEILQFANTIITILTEHIKDPEMLKILATKIQDALYEGGEDEDGS